MIALACQQYGMCKLYAETLVHVPLYSEEPPGPAKPLNEGIIM